MSERRGRRPVSFSATGVGRLRVTGRRPGRRPVVGQEHEKQPDRGQQLQSSRGTVMRQIRGSSLHRFRGDGIYRVLLVLGGRRHATDPVAGRVDRVLADRGELLLADRGELVDDRVRLGRRGFLRIGRQRGRDQEGGLTTDPLSRCPVQRLRADAGQFGHLLDGQAFVPPLLREANRIEADQAVHLTLAFPM